MTSLGLPTEGPSSLGGGMLGGLRHLNGVLKSGEKTKPGEVAKDSPLPPRKLTWNLKIIPLERKIIFKPYIFRFHVSFSGVCLQSETHIPGDSLGNFWTINCCTLPTWQKRKIIDSTVPAGRGDVIFPKRVSPKKHPPRRVHGQFFANIIGHYISNPKECTLTREIPQNWCWFDRPKMCNWTTSAEAPKKHVVTNFANRQTADFFFWSPAWTIYLDSFFTL